MRAVVEMAAAERVAEWVVVSEGVEREAVEEKSEKRSCRRFTTKKNDVNPAKTGKTGTPEASR